jgi:hypothetical protein
MIRVPPRVTSTVEGGVISAEEWREKCAFEREVSWSLLVLNARRMARERAPEYLQESDALVSTVHDEAEVSTDVPDGLLPDTGGVSEDSTPKKRRRAVGPPGARPSVDEPLPERAEEVGDNPGEDRRTLERYLADRPPHHEPR